MNKLTLRVCGAAAVVALSVAVTGITSSSAQADERYCDERAQHYAARHTRGTGTTGGALVGGTVGAIIGKVVGGNTGAGVGALVGGSTGAIVGTDRENQRYEALYEEAYADCMERVSYRRRPVDTRPTQVYSAAPEPWTDEWFDYCHDKYRSFNERTGEYLSYSGEYRMCR